MGSWGINILQDDTVLDIIGDFSNYLKEFRNVKNATVKIIENNQDLISDEDEGPLFWIALGKSQWEYGEIDSYVFNKILSDFHDEKGLTTWKEQSETLYQKRKKVLAEFIQRISSPNPKPKKMPKIIIRKPLFNEGDCLSLNVGPHYYSAALVLQSDHSKVEYGSNLIAVLDYWADKPPEMNDFDMTKVLNLTYGNWNGKPHISWYTNQGFRKYKEKIKLVGNIDASFYRDLKINSYSNWPFFFRAIENQYNIQ